MKYLFYASYKCTELPAMALLVEMQTMKSGFFHM